MNLLVGFVNDANFFLCGLNSQTPVEHCNDPTIDEGALRRRVIIIVCRVLMYILADGMLFYRTIVIWQRSWWIFVFVGMTWIGSEFFQVYSQVIAFDLDSRLIIEAASFWVSALWDVLTSGLIIGRLFYYRRNARETERKESINTYTSLAAVFFEGSLLFSTSRMLLAGLILTKQPFLFSYWSATLVDIAAAVSPLFIILRLALNSFVDPYSQSKNGRGRRPPEILLSSFYTGSPLRTIIFGGTPTSDGSRFDDSPRVPEHTLRAFADPECGFVFSGSKRGEKNDIQIASLN